MDKYCSAEYKRAVSEFVSREVACCVSTLLYELAPKYDEFPDYRDDLLSAFLVPETEEGYEEEYREVFEHWVVSDYLANKLEEHGEKILRDFFGLDVWCRTTTGQCISIDRVICDIYDEVMQ